MMTVAMTVTSSINDHSSAIGDDNNDDDNNINGSAEKGGDDGGISNDSDTNTAKMDGQQWW